MNTHLLPDVRLAHLELAAALQQNSLAAAARHTRSAATQATPAGGFADRHMGSSRVFAGTHDQVSAVRRFARAELGDHPAVDEAVLVASELATNAITHSASGHDGGMFMVHLTAISAGHVVILVTDQGGHGEPRAQHAGPDAESGRGLDIVTSIASLFIPFGDDTTRTIVAVVSPDGGSAERWPCAQGNAFGLGGVLPANTRDRALTKGEEPVMPHRGSDLARPFGLGTPFPARRLAQAGEMAGRSGFAQVTTPGSRSAFLPEAGALPVAAAMEISGHAGDGGLCAACGFGLAGMGEPGRPARASRWVFPGTADQVRRARSALAAALDDYPLADDAVLCASELATNAIRHSASGWPGGTFIVRAEIRAGRSVHVEVHDEGGPWQSGQDADGRMHGLGIVAELAAGFSVHTAAAGGRIVRACFAWPARTRGQS